MYAWNGNGNVPVLFVLMRHFPRSLILDADVAYLTLEDTFSAIVDLVVPRSVVRHEVAAGDVAVQGGRVNDAL